MVSNLALAVFLVISVNADDLSFQKDPSQLIISLGGNPVLKYCYTEVPYKPYIKEFFTPSFRNILQDAPPDHLHHHGIMFAVSVNGISFWAETPECGKQIHKDIVINNCSLAGIKCVKFSHQIEWIPPNSAEVLLLEKRNIVVLPPDAHNCSILLWETNLTLPEDKEQAEISGAHYYGLGLRFVKELEGRGKFFSSSDDEWVTVRGDEQLVYGSWCAYTSEDNSSPLTVVIFSDPQNMYHPTRWFTMTKPFAYLSATLNLHEKPLTIREPLRLRYAIAAWDKVVDKEEVQRLYENLLNYFSATLSERTASETEGSNNEP